MKLVWCAIFLLALSNSAFGRDLYSDKIDAPDTVDLINENIKKLFQGKLDYRPKDVIPKTDDLYDLGSTTVTWRNIYAHDFISKESPVFDIRAYGAVCDNSTDDTAAIQAAIDAAEARGQGVVLVPPVDVACKTTSMLTIESGGVTLMGYGSKISVLAPNFDTDPVITLGGVGGSPERIGVVGLEIAHTITRTGGPSILVDRVARSFITDVEITGSYIGMQYGTAANPSGNVICRVSRFRPNTTGDGIIVYSGAALFIDNSQFNGTPTNGTAAVKVISSADGTSIDGLWILDSTFEQHDNGFWVAHNAGSCANIVLQNITIDRPRTYGVRLEPSGTGSVNQHRYINVQIDDTVGAGDTTAFLLAQSGSVVLQQIEVNDCMGSNLRQRFLHSTGTVTGLAIVGNTSRNGSLKSAGVYEGIFLSSAASTVSIVGNTITGSHNYGIRVSSSAINVSVEGNAISGYGTAAMLLEGNHSTTYHAWSNAGSPNTLSRATLAEILAATPTHVGQPYYCSNCATSAICVSTGTAVGQFSDVSNRTTACN